MAHILDHPEMRDQEPAIAQSLADPDTVTVSQSDNEPRLYYRYCRGTVVGDKFLCVVVKVQSVDAFVITAYFKDRVKKGEVLWQRM